MEKSFNEYVTIKCNKCDAEPIGFFPMRVMFLRPCPCGNNNYGMAHRDWANDNYGDFTLIEKEEWILPSIPNIFL